jgi:hypothetical protein
MLFQEIVNGFMQVILKNKYLNIIKSALKRNVSLKNEYWMKK